MEFKTKMKPISTVVVRLVPDDVKKIRSVLMIRIAYHESHSISTFVNVTLIAMIMGPANTTEFVEVRFSS